MSKPAEFTEEDTALLERCMYRLLRIADYSRPQDYPYFNLASENANGRQAFASLLNRINGLSSQESLPDRLEAQRALYFLKQSDNHLAAAHAEAGDHGNLPLLYEPFVELLQRAGMEPIPDASRASPYDNHHRRAEEEIRLFILNYSPELDSDRFLSGGIIASPSIEINDDRLHAWLRDEKPCYVIDFSKSADIIARAFEHISPEDAATVKQALQSHTAGGDGKHIPQTSDDFGINWDEQPALSPPSRLLLGKLWQDLTKKTQTALAIFEGNGTRLISSLGEADAQHQFVKASIQSLRAAEQSGSVSSSHIR